MMPRLFPIVVAVLLAGGRQTAPAPTSSLTTSGQPVLPDSAVVTGVLTRTHAAGAFARAPQLTLDTVPIVIYDGGSNGDFDLTHVYRAMLFPDGRLLASLTIGQGRLVLFNADGTPGRVVAAFGEGPGDVRSPGDPVALTPDTALVIDGNTHRLNWVTAGGGIVRTAPLKGTVPAFCFRNATLLRGVHLLASNGCLRQGQIDTPMRPPVEVIVMGLDFSAPNTVVKLPGYEMIPFETRYRGVKRIEATMLRFGQSSKIAPWDSGFVSAIGDERYVLERCAIDGHVIARIRVNEPRRAVTTAMREAQIRQQLDRLSGQQDEPFVDLGETKRQAREVPFADSLPPYGYLFPATDGMLWVGDYATLADSTWSATAFRSDGAIVGRLTAHIKGGTPVAFGKDRVLLRLVDDDGVVRFGVFRVVQLKG